MRIILSIIIISIKVYLGWSQVRPELIDSSGYKLLQKVGSYAKDSLNWKIHSNFYKGWAIDENPNIYFYVSKKDSLKSGISSNYLTFPLDEEKILIKKTEFENMGFDVMVYKTYGTSGVRLSNHLLSYNNESLMFLGFHEATHLQISSSVNLPYIYIEAICDLMGTQASLALNKYNPENSNKIILFNNKLESITTQINNCVFASENMKSYKDDCKKVLYNMVSSIDENEKFLKERYQYVINNAYLIRNLSYTKYYYKLKKLFELQNKDFDVFWKFILKLPYSEKLINDILEKEIFLLETLK